MKRCLIDLPENFRKTMAMKEGELLRLGLRNCACEDWECDFCVCPIFEFIFGLKPLHIHIYFYTLTHKRTIKEISNRVNRDRTTVVRLVQSLIENGLTLLTTDGFFFPLRRKCINDKTYLCNETQDLNIPILGFGTFLTYRGYEPQELISAFNYYSLTDYVHRPVEN